MKGKQNNKKTYKKTSKNKNNEKTITKKDNDLIFYSVRNTRNTRKNYIKNKSIKKSNINILKTNFTYYFNEKNYSKNKISAIRFCNFDMKNVVVTIYYIYQSFMFTKDRLLNKWNTEFIYEFDENHDKDLHKIDDPYDWHVHMKIKRHDLKKYMNYFYTEFNLSTKSIKDLNKLIFENRDSKKDSKKDSKDNKINIEINGSNSVSKEMLLKQYKLLYDHYYDTLKFDRTVYNLSIFNLSNYIIRICNLNFKLDDKTLKHLENAKTYILDSLKKQSKNSKKLSNKVNKGNFILVEKNINKFYNPSIDKFVTKNSNKYYMNLVILLLDFLKIKLPKDKLFIFNTFEDCNRFNYLRNIINQSKTNKTNYEIKIYQGLLCYLVNILVFKNDKNKLYSGHITFEMYMNRRLNHEYAWSIFQYFKSITYKNYLNKQVLNTHSSLVKNFTRNNKNKKGKSIDNYIKICDLNLNFRNFINNKTNLNKLKVKNFLILKNLTIKRISALN